MSKSLPLQSNRKECNKECIPKIYRRAEGTIVSQIKMRALVGLERRVFHLRDVLALNLAAAPGTIEDFSQVRALIAQDA